MSLYWYFSAMYEVDGEVFSHRIFYLKFPGHLVTGKGHFRFLVPTCGTAFFQTLPLHLMFVVYIR